MVDFIVKNTSNCVRAENTKISSKRKKYFWENIVSAIIIIL